MWNFSADQALENNLLPKLQEPKVEIDFKNGSVSLCLNSGITHSDLSEQNNKNFSSFISENDFKAIVFFFHQHEDHLGKNESRYVENFVVIDSHNVPKNFRSLWLDRLSSHGHSIEDAGQQHSSPENIISQKNCNVTINNGKFVNLKSTDTVILQLSIDSHLAGCITKTLLQSTNFNLGFLRYASCLGSCLFPGRSYKKRIETFHKKRRHIILVQMTPSNHNIIDIVWIKKISALIAKQCVLDDAMNWLSTLGGAYSALGDQLTHHAENAGLISIQQLQIAKEMNSPCLIIRCRLFFGLSLMQRGKLREAKHLILDQYSEAKKMIVEDRQLICMCHGIWNRLRYLWKRSKCSYD